MRTTHVSTLCSLLVALLLTACGTTALNSDADALPRVGKLWITNSDKFMARVCGEEDFSVLDLELNLTQSQAELTGTFTLTDLTGDVTYAFAGSVREDGEVTGTSTRSDSPNLAFDLMNTSPWLAGTITEEETTTCPDSSQDQMVIDVTFF
jgi:hypothetical protein